MNLRITFRCLIPLLLMLLAAPLQILALGTNNFDCGRSGDNNCTIDEWEYTFGGIGTCDRGLKCGSAWRFCAIGDGVCRNDTRWQSRATNVQSWWSYQAFREQQKIARYEPLNWMTTLASHNAYNNAADGYFIYPNQLFSMTDQLNMGVRALLLDVHHVCGLTCEVRLSHSKENIGASPFDRHIGFGIIEIKQWLNKYPEEVILLQMEEWLEDDSESKDDYTWVLEHYLGSVMFTRTQKDLFSGRWPTLAEMREMGKQVIITGGSDGLKEDHDYFFSGITSSPNPKDFNPQECTLPKNDGEYFLYDPGEKFLGIEESRYRLGGEDLYKKQGIIAENCENSPSDVPCRTVSEIVACGNTEIILDYVGDKSIDRDSENYPMGNRFKDLVWSWQEGTRGWENDNEAALLDVDTGRWIPANLSEEHHYACGHFREGDPSEWIDKSQLTTWMVTEAIGPYHEGGMYCAKEFGPEFVFSVPVNSPQNAQLIEASKKAMISPNYNGNDHDIWLSYRDIRDENNSIYWDRDVPCILGVNATPNELWSPNHKMTRVDLAISHQCSIEPTCYISGISTNELDAQYEDVRIFEYPHLALELRAERSGKNRKGRIYSIDLECVVDESGRTNHTGVDVPVSHDRRVSKE